MKTIITAALLILLISATGYAQTDCKPYVPTAVGTKWEITNYNPKGKETGKVAYELLEKTETDSVSTFKIRTVTYDDKDKETYTNTYSAKCVGGKFEFDMACMINGEQMAAYQNMDVQVDATKLEIPTLDESAGTTLEDGKVVVGVGSGGVSVFKMTVEVTDRKVEAREEKTTPAGTFDCLKLSQKVSTRMLMKIEASSKEWYAEEVGLIRSESYNKKGKMTGYSELTKLEKK